MHVSAGLSAPIEPPGLNFVRNCVSLPALSWPSPASWQWNLPWFRTLHSFYFPPLRRSRAQLRRASSQLARLRQASSQPAQSPQACL